MNLVPTPTTKNAPRKRTPRTEGHGGFFFFFSVLWLLTTNIQKKGYFPIVGGAILTSHFWGQHSRALEIHEDELSPIFRKKDKWRRQRPKNESGTSHEFPFLWNPPTRFKKKQGGNRFPSQFYRLNFIQNFTKTNFRQILMVQCTMVDFELIVARFCDAFRVTIRNLLDFSTDVSFFFPTVSFSLSPSDHDRSRFSVQFGVVLKL